MELKKHALIEAFIFLALCLALDPIHAGVVALAHFVPSVDYLMMKSSFGKRFHRKLFHNIFAGAGVFFTVYWLLSPFIAVLSLANFLFHLALDLSDNGVAVFYPFSDLRLRLPPKN